MVNPPDQDTQGVQTPSHKLVLPPPLEQGQPSASPYPEPTMYMNQTALPPASPGFFTRTLQNWRKEPVYFVLALAIALVLASSIVFVALGANLLLGNNKSAPGNNSHAAHAPALTPTSTVDNQPALPTPASTQPVIGSTPNLQPTSTQPGNQGTLSVQIVSIPDTVHNDTRVHVSIQTSEPGASVHLKVNYDAAPFLYTSSTHTTDGNGNATLTWNVRVLAFGGLNNGVHATVVVIATDQNGQQATSQPVSVTITG